MTNQVNIQRHKYHPLTAQYHNDSEDDDRSGCRNVSHCHQQFFSELHSPGRSHYTNFCNFHGKYSYVTGLMCVEKVFLITPKKNGLYVLTDTKTNLSFFHRKYSTYFYSKMLSQNVLKLCSPQDLRVVYQDHKIILKV